MEMDIFDIFNLKVELEFANSYHEIRIKEFEKLGKENNCSYDLFIKDHKEKIEHNLMFIKKLEALPYED